MGLEEIEQQEYFSIGDVKLEEGMAGWQLHVLLIGDVPSGDDDAP